MVDPRKHVALPGLVVFVWAFIALTCVQAGTDTLRVEGLHAPVELLHDRWGITHIYAQNEHDLFFAQGYNAARDRLFQLELWRRKATGTLAEIQGRDAVEHDIGARLLRFRGDMDAELRHYHPRGPSIVGAFVEGINAFIDRTERDTLLLPVEFGLLGLKPGRWTPEVVVSRHNGLFRNAGTEMLLARIVDALGADATRDLLTLQPQSARLDLDPDVGASEIPLDVLDLYLASRTRVRFEAEDLAHAGSAEVRPGTLRAQTLDEQLDELEPLAGGLEALGSNCWAVRGEHTFSGHTMLANDPHRSLQIPSLRYWVHLHAPGWNVLGSGEPALPGVAIGHNEHGAWGLTIFSVDQEDLYVYRTHPDDSTLYRYRDGWEQMKVLHDTLTVKDEGRLPIRLAYTRHGPVLYQEPHNNRAYALRAAWLETGSAPYLPSLRMDQARSWEEFRRACSYLHTPSENMVWAGVDGTIGWQATGITPIRRNWDGTLPVPGDGRYEWEGFLPVSTLPGVTNPASGWFASANEYNLPADYPLDVGYFWADRFRISRIEEVLRSGRTFTVHDMMRLQLDEQSIPARTLVRLLDGYRPADRLSQRALQALQDWDLVLDAESVGAAVYVLYEEQVWENVLKRTTPDTVRPYISRYFLTLTKVIDWLTFPDGRFGEDPLAGRDELVVLSFEEAVARLRGVLGPVVSRWEYGQAALKHVRLQHPLSGAVRFAVQRTLDVGPMPRGGNGTTVNNTSRNLNQSSGASFRMIVDTGDWDRAVGTNTPGQSGDPNSPHYDDLFDVWGSGRYFPVFFSRSKIESVTERASLLLPE